MSRLYDDLAFLWRLYSPPEHYREEVESFRRRFERHGVESGAAVLHLGSGGGSIDAHLKRHYRVTGVDRSPAMLAQARELNPEVAYVEGDIREVRLTEVFDAVLVHDAISYMTSVAELEEVYRTAAFHLERGGVLVGLPEEIRPRLEAAGTKVKTREVGDATLTVIETQHDPDPSDHAFEAVYVFILRRAGEMRVEVDRHRVGVFDLEDFLGALERAGFEAWPERWELPDWGDEPEMPLLVGVRR